MAKAKVVKDVENLNISIFDNGFTLEYSGRTADDDWESNKMIVPDLETLFVEIKRVVELA